MYFEAEKLKRRFAQAKRRFILPKRRFISLKRRFGKASAKGFVSDIYNINI